MHKLILAVALAILPSSAFADKLLNLAVQWKLERLGYDIGKADGVVGPATRRAISKAAEEYRFSPTLDDFITYFAVRAIRNSQPITDEKLLSAVERSVSDLLRDPSSAQFRKIRRMESGMICGEVNGKNAYGGYAGFQEFMAYASPPIAGGDWFIVPSLDLGPNHCLIDVGLPG